MNFREKLKQFGAEARDAIEHPAQHPEVKVETANLKKPQVPGQEKEATRDYQRAWEQKREEEEEKWSKRLAAKPRDKTA